MSGVKEVLINNFYIDDNNDLHLNEVISFESGYKIIITKETQFNMPRSIYLAPNQKLDGSDFTVVVENIEGKMQVYNSFKKDGKVILRGQWIENTFYSYYYMGNIGITKEGNFSFHKCISDSNGVVYSALYDKDTNHIVPCEVDIINTKLVKYAVTEYDENGILKSYKTYDLPEFVVMGKLELPPEDSVKITVECGSVVLTEGDYFLDNNSANFLRVNGWNVTFVITELPYHLLEIEEDLDIVEFYPMTINVTENANTLDVRGATVLKGNPFDIILKTNNINRYLERINGESLEYVYGNWKHEEPNTVPNANAVVSYTIGDKKIYAYKSEGEIKINFDNTGKAVPHYECTATKDLVVTMVRDDFVVSENLTFRRVEYKPHVYVEKPFTYVFRNLTVTNQCTLDVLDSTIVVEGSFNVEEGATVKCKNLIIN